MQSSAFNRRGKRRFDDDQSTFTKRDRHRARLVAEDAHDPADGVSDGDRWSTWDQSSPTERGPLPYPDWLVTELAATDTELGVLKTGKEADVFLIRRSVPDTDRSCLLAAKRYRSAEHRQFHRDSEYLDGRRVRESRMNRAMAARTTVGREMISQQWAAAEFGALCQLQVAGVPVPYPVQILGTEILLEFVGDPGGIAAPRLAEVRPSGTDLANLWNQLVDALRRLAGLGLAHGDLSAYNLLVHEGRLVMIDLPQVIDVISHPRGGEFLERDVANVSHWFLSRGLGDQLAALDLHPDDLLPQLRYEARLA